MINVWPRSITSNYYRTVSPSTLTAGVTVGTTAGTVMCFALAWYAKIKYEHPLSRAFTWLMVADGAWGISTVGASLAPTAGLTGTLAALTPLLAMGALVAWVQFTVTYTDDAEWLPDWLVNPGNLVLDSRSVDAYGRFLLPAEAPGAGALLQTLLIYLVLLGRFFFASRNLYRGQTALVFVAVTTVIVGTLVYATGLYTRTRTTQHDCSLTGREQSY
jgi:hypothetical protein